MHRHALPTRRVYTGPSRWTGSSRRSCAPIQNASAPSRTVELTVQTKEGPVVNISAESGDVLRTVLLAEKVDLYTTWGKVWQCGGGGSCGTCIVEVKAGVELLSERTQVEQKKLAGKPATWRLACQTLVGDGETSGAVTIGTKPQ